jgi:hypothetical protein
VFPNKTALAAGISTEVRKGRVGLRNHHVLIFFIYSSPGSCAIRLGTRQCLEGSWNCMFLSGQVFGSRYQHPKLRFKVRDGRNGRIRLRNHHLLIFCSFFSPGSCTIRLCTGLCLEGSWTRIFLSGQVFGSRYHHPDLRLKFKVRNGRNGRIRLRNHHLLIFFSFFSPGSCTMRFSIGLCIGTSWNCIFSSRKVLSSLNDHP